MRAFTDSHAHLSYVLERQGQPKFDELVAAYSGTASRILDPGVDAGDFPARKAAFSRYPFVRLAAGIWPDARPLKALDSAIADLEAHVADDACLAVGECGLDYHWMHGTEEQQANLFKAQIDLVIRYQKPLLVHSRDAHADTLKLVAPVAGRVPVLIHCFGYDDAAAREYLSAGCFISFAGNVTYKNARGLHAAAAIVPSNRLLLETDAPYMNPEPVRGKPSSPLDIGRSYAFVAALRNVTIDELEAGVNDSAKALFGSSW